MNHPTRILTGQSAIEEGARLILSGEVVAFPTETVYGLGANAENDAAVARIFAAKGRPPSDPLIVHIPSPDALPRVAVNVPEIAHLLIEKFWPGPLTLILPRAGNISPTVSAGLSTVGVRMPAHPVAQALLAASNVPIAAPSANLFAHSSPTSAQHVYDDLAGRIPLIIDGGPTTVGVESTIVDLSGYMLGNAPRLLRPGGISLDALRAILPNLEIVTKFAETDEAATAPGMLLKHYSPHAEMRLFDGPDEAVRTSLQQLGRELVDHGRRVGLLIAEEDRANIAIGGAVVFVTGSLSDLETVARQLFAGLRDLDTHGVDIILARTYPSAGIGLAIRDRLLRAAEGRITVVGDAG